MRAFNPVVGSSKRVVPSLGKVTAWSMTLPDSCLCKAPSVIPAGPCPNPRYLKMKSFWLTSLLKKLPWRYLCALGILAIGLLFLGIYALFKGSGSASLAVTQSKPLPPFSPAEVVLCGNALVSLSGEIIAKQWLEGFGDNPPNVKRISTADQLVIVAGNNGMTGAFGFDGKAKPLPNADGKPIGPAGFNQSFTETVYARDGNLWHGSVDWQNGTIKDPRRISDIGYFRPEVFRSTWLWHEGDLLVPHMGKTLQVALGSGSVKEVPVNLQTLQHGMSPLGTFAVTPVRGRLLGIVDLLTGETKQHDLRQRIRKFLWLTPTKVAIHIGNNQVAQYDHATKKLEGPQQSDEGIADIAAPSPNGSCFLVIGGKAITVLDLQAKKDAELKLPFTEVEWISNEELLCSISVIDTDQRGVWLVNKSGEMERLSNQPMDSGRGNPSPILRTKSGALYISRGNLWTYGRESKALKQLTQSGGLRGPIQALGN